MTPKMLTVAGRKVHVIEDDGAVSLATVLAKPGETRRESLAAKHRVIQALGVSACRVQVRGADRPTQLSLF